MFLQIVAHPWLDPQTSATRSRCDFGYDRSPGRAKGCVHVATLPTARADAQRQTPAGTAVNVAFVLLRSRAVI